MPNFKTFITIVTTLLVFLTGVFLAYDQIRFRNYSLPIPQWAGLLFAGITFTFVVVDQLLRGFVEFEEEQRRSEDRARAVAREAEEDRRREEDLARTMAREAKQDREREEDRTRAENERAEARERQTRRTRIENQYRLAVIRHQLDPSPTHRQQLENILSLLEEYGDAP